MGCNSQIYRVVELPGTWLASADLRSYQYYGVILNDSGTVALPTSTDAVPDGWQGILMNEPYTGEPCIIATIGSVVPAYVYTGTILAGSLLAHCSTASNQGKFILATDGLTVLGRALQAVSATNNLITVELWQPAIVADVSVLGVGN
jgi:hypothetical protein